MAEQQRCEVTAGDSLASLATPEQQPGQKAHDRVQKYCERLASVAVESQAGWYGLFAYGKALTANHIKEIDDSEIEWLYARYEARLGAAMTTKTLGSTALPLYAGLVSMFLPIPAENQPGLITDLEGDPFVGHALSSATYKLYHRSKHPLTAALTTIKHCQFGHRCPAVIKHDGDGGESAGEARRDGVNSGAGTESF